MMNKYKKIKKMCLMALFSLAFLGQQNIMAMYKGPIEGNIYNGFNYKTMFDQKKILSKYKNVLIQEGLESVNENTSKESETGCLDKVKSFLSCGFCKNRKPKKLELKPLKEQESDSSSDIEELTNIPNTILSNTEEIVVEESSKKKDQIKNKKSGEIKMTISEESKTSEDLDKELLTSYKWTRAGSMAKSMIEPTFSLAVKAGAFYVGSQIMEKKQVEGKSNSNGDFSSTVLINIVGEAIDQYGKGFYNMLFSLNDPLKKYEELYAKKKRFLDKTLQESIEEKFSLARKSDFMVADAVKFLDIALNVPLKSQAVKESKEYENDITALLECYNDEVRDEIKNNMQGHHDRFSSVAHPNKRQKIILYLQGPPGLGKTFITETVSKLMGLPIRNLDATENLIGSKTEPGRLLEAICSPDTPRNAIIFIDEANHLVGDGPELAAIKALLEPDKGYFKSPYLNAKVDISHFCFILAGNSEIKVDKNKDNGALLSRFKTIHINEMKKEIMIKIIIDKFVDIVDKENEKALVEELEKLITLRVTENKNAGLREIITECNATIDRWRAKNKNSNANGLSQEQKNEWDKKIELAGIERKQREVIAKEDEAIKNKILEFDKQILRLKQLKLLQEKEKEVSELKKVLNIETPESNM